MDLDGQIAIEDVMEICGQTEIENKKGKYLTLGVDGFEHRYSGEFIVPDEEGLLFLMVEEDCLRLPV